MTKAARWPGNWLRRAAKRPNRWPPPPVKACRAIRAPWRVTYVSATRTGAAVRMGRKAVPYAGPVEFGGWPEGREYIPGGRYLFPAAHALANSAASLYAAGVQRAIDGFNWTNETNNPEAIHD